MKEERPILDLPRTQTEITLDVLAGAGLAIGLGLLLFYFPGLPERIPVHFDAKGQPDDYGSKNLLLILMGVATALAAMMWYLVRIPHKFNYPTRVTAQNAESLYYKGRLLIRILNAGIVCMFSFINWRTMEIVKGQAEGLGQWFLPVVLIITVGLPVYLTFQMMGGKK